MLALVDSSKGQPRWKVECRYCHRDDVVPGRRDGEGQVKTKIIQRGWQVTRSGECTCPACVAKFKAINAAKAREPAMKDTVVKMPEKGREMGIDDKRRINKALAEYYRDDGKGYKGEETDQTLSARLSVPMAWVANIRRENFGSPEKVVDLDAFKRQLAALRENIDAVTKDVENALDRITRFENSIEKVEAEIKEIEV